MLDGIVYKLFCKDADATEFYIGSTKEFHRRQLNHKTLCNNEKRKNYNLKVYKYIRDNGGYDKFDYEILELGEYENKYQLQERERFFINTLKPTLNNYIPNRTLKEYYQDNKEIKKEYAKEYSDNNREKINKRQKEYRVNNREKINEKRKEKIECKVCNCMIMRTYKARHNRTQKHLNNLNNTG